jgi:hypothetical protein
MASFSDNLEQKEIVILHLQEDEKKEIRQDIILVKQPNVAYKIKEE